MIPANITVEDVKYFETKAQLRPWDKKAQLQLAMIKIICIPQGMEFDFKGNLRYQKSWYQVFKCNSQDSFDYDEDMVLFEHDNLANAHSYAYNAWLESNKSTVYAIIQPYDKSYRGGYGFKEEDE
jgi:hypothetical protein